jgi:hypothetical protein
MWFRSLWMNMQNLDNDLQEEKPAESKLVFLLDYLDEVMRRFPADWYILVDHKPRILAITKALLGEQVVTLHVCQGTYAHAAEHDAYPPPDVAIDTIAELQRRSRPASRFRPSAVIACSFGTSYATDRWPRRICGLSSPNAVDVCNAHYGIGRYPSDLSRMVSGITVRGRIRAYRIVGYQ